MSPRGAALAVFLGFVLAAHAAQAQSDPDQAVPVPGGDGYADTDPSALTDFRPALDGYGAWTDDDAYGTVWTPDPTQVGPTFQPYDTAGSWDFVDNDYVWVSDFEWGWVCFHYGRWAWSAGHWVWIPGREYAGAWVSWRVGDAEFDVVGWSPLAPSWGWMGGSATALGFGTQEPWAFTSGSELLTPNVGAHAVAGNRATPIVNRTRPFVRAQPTVNGTQVPHGPSPASLGIDPARLTAPTLPAREVRARQLARSSTAQALGAHAPAPHVFRATPRPAGGSRAAAAPVRAVGGRGKR